MNKDKITVTMTMAEFEKLAEANANANAKPTTVAEAIAELFKLAREINQTKKATVFVNYSGHVDLLEVRVWRGNWDGDVEPVVNDREYLNNVSESDSLRFIELCKREILKAAGDDQKPHHGESDILLNDSLDNFEHDGGGVVK